MLLILSYLIWNGSPEIIHLGFITLRWYNILFALGFIVGSIKFRQIFKQENRPVADVDVLVLYIIIGTCVGARLGHVIFYDFAYYIKHPLEAILPIAFEPNLKLVGYRGLASHGGAIGILLALYLYANYSIKIGLFPPKWQIKRQQRAGGQRFLWILDRLVIFVALGGSCIRIGNFMNSEIIGKPTHSNYGIVFVRDAIETLQHHSNIIAEISINKHGKLNTELGYPPLDMAIYFKSYVNEENIKSYIENYTKALLANNRHITKHIFVPADQPFNYTLSKTKKNAYVAHIDVFGKPRHPTQLYEALTTFLLFCLLYYRWSRKKQYLRDGELSGIFITSLFMLRFVHEFFKENQVSFEDSLPFNMGQWLSIPFVLLGIVLFWYSRSGKASSG